MNHKSIQGIYHNFPLERGRGMVVAEHRHFVDASHFAQAVGITSIITLAFGQRAKPP